MNVALIVVCSCLFIVVLLFLVVFLLLFKPNFIRVKGEQPVETDFPPLMKYNPVILDGADWFYSKKPEDVFIKSFDGLSLYGQFLPAENGEKSAKGTMLLIHGFHGLGIRDYAAFAKFYHEMGFNILMPDQRAHGKSGGTYITFGIKERFDCRNWIFYINERLGSQMPVCLHGNSMGCATVVMTSGFELPENVKCIIADCGYTSPYEIMKKVLVQDYHLPVFPILPIAGILAKILGGFKLKEYSTLDALKTDSVPVFFIHGENDAFVPSYMGSQNYEACKAPKKLYMAPGAAHSESYYINPAEYQSLVKEFISQWV
ncbi:MAG: alpha/beta hydrolase [Treponemataceae bacterium]|nr:alpha/beta hydrolase [Treponemataceae bacterium]